MSRQVEADRSMRDSMSLMELWRKPSYRKRMICGFITMFASESSGILVIYSRHHKDHLSLRVTDLV